MPYMTISAINSAIDHIAATYPAIASVSNLPNKSVGNRDIKQLKIANGSGANRAGVLFLGGTHARELVNPEAVLAFALKLCDAYVNDTGIAFGPKTYSSTTVKQLVDVLDLFLIPLVNPDGRNHCMVAGGDPMWRKNRSTNAGSPCRGVDLNRNSDFLWSSGIGTSSSACSDIFKGQAAFSEPETRNVKAVLDANPNIASMIDIHSYSELVLYPWGDDDTQTGDPNQNFQNPAFNGQRGVTMSGYAEYMPPGDLEDFVRVAGRIRDGIAAVRGHAYTVQPSVQLYPTSGTFKDYAYSRHYVDTGLRRVLAFTLETGLQFQPGDAEKDQIIEEVGPGLVECMLDTMCPGDVVADLLDAIFPMRMMRAFREQNMRSSSSGARYMALLGRHRRELVQLVLKRKPARSAAKAALEVAAKLTEKPGAKISAEDTKKIMGAFEETRPFASKDLKAAFAELEKEMTLVEGQTLSGALVSLDKHFGQQRKVKDRVRT